MLKPNSKILLSHKIVFYGFIRIVEPNDFLQKNIPFRVWQSGYLNAPLQRAKTKVDSIHLSSPRCRK